jgi:hypothetical protein
MLVEGKILVDVPTTTTTRNKRWTSWPTPPSVCGTTVEGTPKYSYQQGSFAVDEDLGICYIWVYVQFSDLGGMQGPLKLKNLPRPLSSQLPHWVGGMSSYATNLHPASSVQLWLRGNGAWDHFLIDGQPPSGQNPLPMTDNDLNGHTQIILCAFYPVDPQS